MSKSTEDVKHLQIPLQDISSATNGFSNQYLIARGGFGNVYKGVSERHGRIAIKRLDRRHGQGDHEFKTEVALLSKYKHENIVSLLGFCDEYGVKILVYKYESNGSLDRHLNSEDLTWIQRLRICLGVAHGLQYLHDDAGQQHRILHRDVKSSNILLDENWKPKISDFGLARVGPANIKPSFVAISNPCGTHGYVAPDYVNHGHLTQKSDVYSFGVVLCEVLCGKLVYVKDKNESVTLPELVQKHYRSGTLQSIIPAYLYEQINGASLLAFSNIAYECLKDNGEERPKMKQVVEQLQEALHNQPKVNKPNGKKSEKETQQAAEDEENGDQGSFLPPPHRPKEFVFLVFMHCDDCARRVRRCLKGFEGVEDVKTDCENRKVVVKGEKVDPLKVLEQIHKETKRKVELLPLAVPKPLAEKAKKGEKKKPLKQKDKKEEVIKKPEEGKKVKKEENLVAGDEKNREESKGLLPPPLSLQEIALRVLFLHCEDCAKKFRKYPEDFKDAEDVLMGCETRKVVVKETQADPLNVPEIVQRKSHQKRNKRRPVELNKTKQEEPHEKEDGKDDLTSRDICFFIYVIVVCFFIIFPYVSKLVKLFTFKHY